MEYGDFIRSGIGAALGFFLAQLINVAKLARDWWNRPRLTIELAHENSQILSHAAQVGPSEFYDERIFGFYVRNLGRRIATGVRFQLIKIEYREKNWPVFADVSNQAYELALYKGAGRKSEDSVTVLVPTAGALVELAAWRETMTPYFPSYRVYPTIMRKFARMLRSTGSLL